MSTNVEFDLKHRSRALTEGPSRAAARAYLKGIGFDDEALSKPIIGVASTWIETMPCNFHLRALAAKVKDGIREAGGTPMELNTIAISDGITMGTSGMRDVASCRARSSRTRSSSSRAVISFDGVVALSGCDKTIPGTVMALARLDLPSVMLYGGSIMPGKFRGRDVTILDVFEAVGAHAARQDERRGPRRDRDASPAPARAPAAASSPPTPWRWRSRCWASRRSAQPWSRRRTRRRPTSAFECGKLAMDVLKRGRDARARSSRASRSRTRSPRSPMSGGSTNVVLHLLAIAREAGVDARHRRLRRHLRAHAAALRPASRAAEYLATDLYAAGGVPVVREAPARRPGCSTTSAITVTGRTIGEHAAEAAEPEGQEVVRPLDRADQADAAASRSCTATSRRRAAS